jgi:hypothetical protein
MIDCPKCDARAEADLRADADYQFERAEYEKRRREEVERALDAAQAEAARLRGALNAARGPLQEVGVEVVREGYFERSSYVHELFKEAYRTIDAALSSPAPPAIEAIGAIEQAAPELRTDCVERNPPAQSHTCGAQCVGTMCDRTYGAPDPMRLAALAFDAGVAALEGGGMSVHEWKAHRIDGWSVCQHCGIVRNHDRDPTPCRGALPEIRLRAETVTLPREVAERAARTLLASARWWQEQGGLLDSVYVLRRGECELAYAALEPYTKGGE